ENAPAVVDVCRRLDGLPLALELAAGWTAILRPQDLRKRLDRDGALPPPPTPLLDVPERQRSLRQAAAWSHALLTPAQQRLLRRLALFPGGASAEAISAVCGDRGSASGTAPGRPAVPPEEAPRDVLGDLAALVERNLVQALAADEAEEPRFGLLHTLRAAARERLAPAGGGAALPRTPPRHLPAPRPRPDP